MAGVGQANGALETEGESMPSWRRLTVLVIVGTLGGYGFTLLWLLSTEGNEATADQHQRLWLGFQETVAPLQAIVERVRSGGVDERDYSVYLALVHWHLGDLARGPVTLGRQTEWPEEEHEPLTRLMDLLVDDTSDAPFDPAAVRDFFVKNQRPLSLTRSPISDRCILMGRRVFEQRVRDNDFALFNGAFGFMTVSRPGYDAFGRHAVVYVSLHCGVTCGHGSYFQLEKRDGTWQVAASHMIWVG